MRAAVFEAVPRGVPIPPEHQILPQQLHGVRPVRVQVLLVCQRIPLLLPQKGGPPAVHTCLRPKSPRLTTERERERKGGERERNGEGTLNVLRGWEENLFASKSNCVSLIRIMSSSSSLSYPILTPANACSPAHQNPISHDRGGGRGGRQLWGILCASKKQRRLPCLWTLSLVRHLCLPPQGSIKKIRGSSQRRASLPVHSFLRIPRLL